MDMKIVFTLTNGTQVVFEEEGVPDELKGLQISNVVVYDQAVPKDALAFVPWRANKGGHH